MPPQRLRFAIGFCWTIAAAGGVTGFLAVQRDGVTGCASIAFVVLLIGAVLGELVPLRLPLRGGDEEVNLSTPFTFALLMSVGLAPALIAQAVASLIQDLFARKPIWRSAFNVGQYTLSLAAASVVLSVLGVRPDADASATTMAGLGAVLVAGCAFFVVNSIIVGIAVANYQSTPLRAHLLSDLATTTLMAGVSISLAPLVVAAVDRNPLLVGLFVLPFVALHRWGRLACDSARQALTDPLTGLPNRTRFAQLVDEAIGGSRGSGQFAVMLLDLNRFKDINDTLGHHYGDLLLECTASRLRGSLRESDAIARLGGDEFAVLIDGNDSGQVAERLNAALRPPVEIDGFLLEVDASIGTARYPDDGRDLETLLRRADVAMYAAKERHLDHLSYTPEIDEYDPARLALVADLRRALDADELVVYYQPTIDLKQDRPCGAEALVRWDHPRLGLLQPGAFVEMAEHTGLIKPLTHRVLSLALSQCAEWRADGLQLQMAVNVSPRSLLDRELPKTIAAALRTTGLRAADLKLEITETAIMVDPIAASRVLEELATMGVALSIDDFGTGYSSLAYLRRLPVDEVKIDRSFVKNMTRDDGDHAIVRSTIDLARNLGLIAVAEGVEDRATLNELRRLGCDVAQGYFISRPIPATELSAWAHMQDHPPGSSATLTEAIA